MSLDRLSMGLVREEARLLARLCDDNADRSNEIVNRVIGRFNKRKPLDASEIRNLGGDLDLNRPEQFGPRVLAHIGTRTSPASVWGMLHYKPVDMNVQPLVPTSRGNTEKYVDRGAVIPIYWYVVTKRKDMVIRTGDMPLTFTFHALSRMVERGFAKRNPVSTFANLPDASALYGLAYVMATANARLTDREITSPLPLGDGALVCLTQARYVTPNAPDKTATGPQLMWATCQGSRLQTHGKVVHEETDINPRVFGKSPDGDYVVGGLSASTYLSINELNNTQESIMRWLRNFLSTNHQVLSELPHVFYAPQNVPSDRYEKIEQLVGEMGQRMRKQDWTDSFYYRKAV